MLNKNIYYTRTNIDIDTLNKCSTISFISVILFICLNTFPPIINNININNIFSKNFDITWAFQDVDHNAPKFGPETLAHKIGDRKWDILPNEKFSLNHKDCYDSNIIYQYNNEYFRCDDFKKLHEFTDGNRTGQVFLTEGKNRYMALLFQADLDYNEAHYFNNEEDAEICAEDWVLKK